MDLSGVVQKMKSSSTTLFLGAGGGRDDSDTEPSVRSSE